MQEISFYFYFKFQLILFFFIKQNNRWFFFCALQTVDFKKNIIVVMFKI